MNSIRSATPYCSALCRASCSRVRSLSIAMTQSSANPSTQRSLCSVCAYSLCARDLPRSHVLANSIVFPPIPQNASTITSHRHLSAICWAIGCGVTENQPVWSSKSGSSSYSANMRCLCAKSADQLLARKVALCRRSRRFVRAEKQGRISSHFRISAGTSL